VIGRGPAVFAALDRRLLAGNPSGMLRRRREQRRILLKTFQTKGKAKKESA
jgi:hypothetical protein